MKNGAEKKYKKGEIILPAKSFVLSIYDVLFGRVGVYVDYGTPDEHLVVEIGAGDFLNVVSFLETRPRTTTAVALETTIVREVKHEHFGEFFRKNPAKIMSLLEHMSARMRALQKAYMEACHALEEYADTEKLKNEKQEWYSLHNSTYNFWSNMFFTGGENH